MALRHRTVITGPAGSPWYMAVWCDGSSLALSVALAGYSASFMAAYAGSQLRTTAVWTTDSVVTEVDVATGATIGAFPVTGATGAGTNAAEPLPPATQFVLRLRTGVYMGGREIRGRAYLPGITEAASTTGVPSAAATTAVNNMHVAADLAATAINPAFERAVYSPTNATIVPVSSVSIWNQFGSVRSRRD